MGSESLSSAGSGASRLGLWRHREASDAGFVPRQWLRPIFALDGARLPDPIRQQLDSIAAETNPEIFFESLIALGRNCAQQGRPELALALYSLSSETLRTEFPSRPATHEALRARALRESNALLGRGDTGLRFETLTRSLAREATNPIALGSMACAGLAFSVVRSGVLARLLASPGRNFLTAGFGSRAVATMAGFTAENLAFVYSNRLMHEAAGVQQDWSLSAQGHELLGSALVLGSLKLSGALGNGIVNRAAGIRGGAAIAVSPRIEALRGFTNQASMLLGILGGHQAEVWAGLRQPVEGATSLSDAVATLIQFNVAGRLMAGALGPEWARLQHELEARSESLDHASRPPLADLIANHFMPQWIPAGAERSFRPSTGTLEQLGNTVMMASMKGETGRGRRSGRGLPPGRALGGTQRLPSSSTPPSDSAPPSDLAETKIRVPVSPVPDSDALGAADTVAGQALLPPRLPLDLKPEGTQAFPPGYASGAAPAIVDEPTINEPGKTVWEPGRFLPGNRYELLRLIGAGGQGDVWEGFDRGAAQRTVAIKRLRLPDPNQPGLSETERASRRKQAEGLKRHSERERAISSLLEAPFIVPVYDLVEYEPGLYAQVFRYIPGHDLENIQQAIDLLERKPDAALEEEIAPYQNLSHRIDLFRRVLDAVDFMHQRGISHRDLKPANVRVDTDRNIYLLDLGLAKRDGDPSNRVRMSLPAKSRAEAHLTQVDEFKGTPIYMPPESWSSRSVSNFRSWDIFSLGVMLYEWIGGSHPFAKYPDAVATGEAIRPKRNRHGQTEFNIHAIQLWATPKMREQYDPPSFRELRPSEASNLMDELERVARTAFHPDPLQRFHTVREFIQALELAPAIAEYRRYNEIRDGMARIHQEMLQLWEGVNAGHHFSKNNPGLQRQINELIYRRAAWHQGYEKVVDMILRATRFEPWPEASKLIAQMSWERLVDGGDRMDQVTRELLISRIREYDVVTDAEPVTSMKLALDNAVPVTLTPHEIHSSKRVNGQIRLRVVPVLREQDANGIESLNFREAEPILEGRLAEVASQLNLRSGYYVFDFYYPEEVRSPKYAPMRVPIHVTLSEARGSIRDGKPLHLDFEFVPRAEVPEGMVVIHKGHATIGHDFIHDGHNPLDVYSKPQRQVYFETYAMDRHPRTVGDYFEFVRHELGKGNRMAKQLIPRMRIKPREDWLQTQEDGQPIEKQTFIREFMALRKQHGLLEAIQVIKSRFTGTVYFWETRTVKRGKNERIEIIPPFTDMAELERFRADSSPNKKLGTHVDALGDPILETQPVANIDFISADAFRRYESDRLGIELFIQSGDEKERVDRSGLPFTTVTGYEFDPTFVNSRNIYDNSDDRYIRPVGEHPWGAEFYRDRSLYGTIDNLGNVREFTSTSHKDNDIISLSGGSVYVPYGPFFLTYARPGETKGDVTIASGGIRLVKRFSEPAKK